MCTESSLSLTQVVSEARQLVLSLQNRERAADRALARIRVVHEKISGMKDYQDDVENMSDCWRTQGRKALVSSLQQENRQISQLKNENRELRCIIEIFEEQVKYIMEKHRSIVLSLAQQTAPTIASNQAILAVEGKLRMQFEDSLRLLKDLEDCFSRGEARSNNDNEMIAKLMTENKCLRELLNISSSNEPDVFISFRNLVSSLSSDSTQQNSQVNICDVEDFDGTATPTTCSQNYCFVNSPNATYMHNDAIKSENADLQSDVQNIEPLQ